MPAATPHPFPWTHLLGDARALLGFLHLELPFFYLPRPGVPVAQPSARFASIASSRPGAFLGIATKSPSWSPLLGLSLSRVAKLQTGSMAAPPLLLLVGALALLAQEQVARCDAAATCVGVAPAKRRPEVVSIADFGGVGDGRTLNTWAFRKAVYRIQHRRRRGGTELRVPAGTWLTGSFNLTSHMTLFLARGAVLKATRDAAGWPLVEPLPSYGRGRELPGPRYASFINGNGLRDVVITGEAQLLCSVRVALLLFARES